MELNFWESFFGVKDNDNNENRFINRFNQLLPTMNQFWGVKRAIGLIRITHGNYF